MARVKVLHAIAKCQSAGLQVTAALLREIVDRRERIPQRLPRAVQETAEALAAPSRPTGFLQ